MIATTTNSSTSVNPRSLADLDIAILSTAAFASVGAFGLPSGSGDAAVLVRLPPGGYTVTVSGVANTTGNVLVEIYDVP